VRRFGTHRRRVSVNGGTGGNARRPAIRCPREGTNLPRRSNRRTGGQRRRLVRVLRCAGGCVSVRPVSVLCCARCGAVLSRPVQIGAAPDMPAPALVVGEAPIAAGAAFCSREPLHRRLNGRPRWHLETAPQVWMSLDDLLAAVRIAEDAARRSGCCGLDGCDGPNRVCGCGAYVGTEQSDCWMPRLFVPDPVTTRWAEG